MLFEEVIAQLAEISSRTLTMIKVEVLYLPTLAFAMSMNASSNIVKKVDMRLVTCRDLFGASSQPSGTN